MTATAEARHPGWKLLIGLLVVLDVVITLAPLRGIFIHVISPQDEGVLLEYPTAYLHGAVPNGTFESVYGPTWIMILAGAFKIFGHGLLVERLVGLGYRVLIIVGTYLLLRKQGHVPALCGAGITAVIAQVAFPAAALPVFGAIGLGMIAVVAGHEARARSSLVFAATAGGVAGLALGFRPDIVLPLLLAAPFVCWGWSRRQAGVAVAAGAVTLIPVWINFAQAGVRHVVRGEVLDPILVFPAGRQLPFSGLTTAAAGVAICGIVISVAVCVLEWLTWHRHRTWDRLVVSAAVFALGLIPYMTSRWDIAHVAIVATASYGLLPVLVAQIARGRLGPPIWLRVLLAGLVVPAALFWNSSIRVMYSDLITASLHGHATHVAHDGRNVIVPAGDRQNLQLLLAETEQAGAQFGHRLAVLPADPAVTFYNDTYLYYLLPHFTPSTYYLEMEPGVANGQHSRLAHDLGTTDIVITDSRYRHSSEPNKAGTPGSLKARHYLAQHFRLVSVIGSWRLYVRSGA